MAALDDIREQFPYLAFLINDPEIGQLLSEAVDPNLGYSPQRFQAKLMATDYWRTHSQAAREWDILSNTDAASANQARQNFSEQLWFLANQMGVKLSPDEVAWYSEYALRNGLDINNPLIREGMAKLSMQPGKSTAGAIQTGEGLARAVANGKYMLPINPDEARQWGMQIAMGIKTQADLEMDFNLRAQMRYPHLAKDLREGATMQDLFSGHIATIAEELELNPEMVDLTKGRWLNVIDTYDFDTQSHRPLTLSETRTLAREDDRYWATAGGQEQGATMANYITKTFGKKA